MKRIILPIIIGVTLLISCKGPNSPNTDENNKEYSIIFNGADQILGEIYALGVINPDGTGIKKIGPGLTSIFSFSISDDGLIAVYLNRLTMNPYIIVSNLKNMTDYQFSDIEKASTPIVSPDGAYIAYKLAGSTDLHVMNIDGSNKITLVLQQNPMYIKWSSDSKGIIYAFEYSTPSSPKIAYYIDKDGTNGPVEVENPFMQYGAGDLEYYSMNQFTRAGSSNLPDSVGFSPWQFNKQKNKAWNILTRVIAPRKYTFMLFGYDLSTKTEKVIIDSTGSLTSSLISWSPNDEDIAVFTQNGLEIVRVDGTRNKILSYNISQITNIYHKWIPRLN